MEYRIIRSRRKSLSIEITPYGEVIVRAPSRMAKRDIEQFLERKADWITAHLTQIERSSEPPLSADEFNSLIRQAKEAIPPRVFHYAQILGVGFGRITIRTQHSRWGSCSSAGNLTFNCLLMLAPEAVLDYVIVHELCHRKEMNHSPRFWAEVENVLPDYRVQKAWLKEHGTALLGRLPKK